MNLAIMAFTLLIMAFSQCKKQEQSISDTVETISITLRPNNNNGTKADVNPNMGTVVFTQGDVVYVSSNGKFVGTLTHNGNTFSGNITNPEVGQPLYFYFFGNKTPSETLTAGSSTQCSVIISDQTENLPVISCGPSNEIFTGSGLYTAFFYNKCALVKFNVTTPSNWPICITGMYNKVTVDFTQNTVTPSIDGDGVIKLPAGNGENVEKWAILLPQEALDGGTEGSAYSEIGTYTGIRGAIPTIVENDYLTTGIPVTVNTVNLDTPIGAINGAFSVSSSKQVLFSQGNLQYQASTNIWRFAENQWDCIGEDNANISPTYDGWIDLFGWGTSGWDSGNTYYHPWDTATYGSLYGPPGNYDLTGSYSHADWGVHNPISNGGNTANQWRTLTYAEWEYVFSRRTTTSGIRYVSANVNGVNGVILLPDNWSTSTYSLNTGAGFNNNVISASQWITLEQHGAVFLPVAGRREGTSVYEIGSRGYYWPVSNVFAFWFGDSGTGYISNVRHYYGFSVRLVHDVE